MPRTRQPVLTDEQRRIGAAMRELRRGVAMQRFRERVYGESPLDVGQHDALDVIVTAGEVRMGDVAAALRIEPSTATRTVARLEEAGLVERRRSGADARAVVVAPTGDGRAVHAATVATATAAMDELLSRFSTDEQRQLAELLGRLVDAIDEITAVLPPASVSG
jgi:DNA-binding MarR family transcriptional regulator